MNPASLSFATSWSTFSTCETEDQSLRLERDGRARQIRTLPPPTRFGGSATLSVSRIGVRSTPRSTGVSFSMGFFLAFMMLGKDA